MAVSLSTARQIHTAWKYAPRKATRRQLGPCVDVDAVEMSKLTRRRQDLPISSSEMLSIRLIKREIRDIWALSYPVNPWDGGELSDKGPYPPGFDKGRLGEGFCLLRWRPWMHVVFWEPRRLP